MFFSLNRSRKIKPFTFSSRYYDEDKEKIENRRAQIEAEVNGTASIRSVGSAYRLRDRWQKNKNTTNFEKKSNVRLVFIIALLFALCYWLLYY